MADRLPVGTTSVYRARPQEVCAALGIPLNLSDVVTMEAMPGALVIFVAPHRVAHGDIRTLLIAFEQRINEKIGAIMATQDDINAAVAQISAFASDITAQVAQLGTDVTNIQAEIATLSGAGVDTSALNAAVASLAGTQQSLDAAVTSVGNLAPVAAPEPPPVG